MDKTTETCAGIKPPLEEVLSWVNRHFPQDEKVDAGRIHVAWYFLPVDEQGNTPPEPKRRKFSATVEGVIRSAAKPAWLPVQSLDEPWPNDGWRNILRFPQDKKELMPEFTGRPLFADDLAKAQSTGCLLGKVQKIFWSDYFNYLEAARSLRFLRDYYVAGVTFYEKSPGLLAENIDSFLAWKKGFEEKLKRAGKRLSPDNIHKINNQLVDMIIEAGIDPFLLALPLSKPTT